MVKSQVILGIVFMVISVFLLFLIPVVGWVYGPVFFLMGLALIIWRNTESEIEKIKPTNKKGGKK